MKVLVTGARGFLGRVLVAHLLREGVEVRALVRPGGDGDLGGAEILEGDLCDPEVAASAVAGMDGVVHAAARVETTGPWEAFAEVNIRATQRLIRAAKAAGVQRFVHISSLGVYAVPRDGIEVRDDSPYEREADSRGHYSRSKLAADRLARSEAEQGAPVVILRPGLLYGPGKRPPLARQSFALGSWRLLLARRDYPLPFSHVENVAAAAWRALQAPPEALGRAFVVVDENVPQEEYTRLYRQMAHESWRPVYLPVPLVALVASLAERLLGLARRRSPITRHQVERATRRAVFRSDGARELLGWQPGIPVAEGLAATFDSLRGASRSTDNSSNP